MNKSPKIAKFFECEKCDYSCSKKSEWNRHMLTRKHKNRTNRTKNIQKISNEKFICECGKSYNARNSLWYHKKKCEYEEKTLKTLANFVAFRKPKKIKCKFYLN